MTEADTIKPVEPDATTNTGCYTCSNYSCSCGKNDDYIKKLVPKLLSKIRSNAAANNTGNERTPKIAVTKNAHIVSGNFVMDIPLVRRLIIVTI